MSVVGDRPDVGSVLALGGWLSQRRSAVVAAAFESTLLGKAKLSSMNGAVCHIICATDLQMGPERLLFQRLCLLLAQRVGDTRHDAGRAGGAGVCCVAGRLQRGVLPLKRFGLPEKRVVAERRHSPPHSNCSTAACTTTWVRSGCSTSVTAYVTGRRRYR